MKVTYDYQIFAVQEYGGISRYYHEISSRIARMEGLDVGIICPLYVNEYFDEYVSNCQIRQGIKIDNIPKTYTLKQIINQAISNLILNRSHTDIIHETLYSPRIIGNKHHKRVVTVHDTIDEKFAAIRDPGGKFGRDKALAVQRADRVICVSESTRKDMLEILDVDEKKVSTIYVAATANLSLGKDIQQIPNLNQSYLLYVGTRVEYKNFDGLLTAYHHSQKLNQDFQLVCFGGGSFSNVENAKIADLKLQGKVIQVSGDDNKLAYLYRHATAFIYPSLYEGFGIPPLEAMAFDCPVVCSNTSSIPEVVGDAGEYFDPYNVEQIIDAIEKVVYSNHRSSNLKKLGHDRTKLFSWDLCAQQTSEVYRSLL